MGDTRPELVSLILRHGGRWPRAGQLDPASWGTLAHNWSAWHGAVIKMVLFQNEGTNTPPNELLHFAASLCISSVREGFLEVTL